MVMMMKEVREKPEKRYSKCSKVLNTSLFLFSNKVLVIRAGFHNDLFRKANRLLGLFDRQL